MWPQTALDWALRLPFAAALVAAILAAIILHSRLLQPMGPPSWSFSTSWASNITVVGGIFAFVAAIALTKNDNRAQLLSHDQYVVFSVVFPLIAGIAPLVYTCLARLTNSNPGIRIEGWVITFIFASFFTVWGSLGQILLQALLLRDIWAIANMPQSWSCFLDIILGLLGLGLAIYSVHSIVVTVNPPKTAALGAAAAPGWSLL